MNPDRPRWIWTRLLACLLLGVAFNWLLGAVVASVHPRLATDTNISASPAIAWPSWAPSSWPPLSEIRKDDQYMLAEMGSTGLMDDVSIHATGSSDGFRTTDDWSVREQRIGWPMRSLTMGRADYTPGISGPTTSTSSGVAFRRAGIRIRIPLVVLPVGFAVNSLVFTAIFSAGLIACRALLRRRARRRSRCTRCGYDITGLNLCPECANPLADSASLL